VTAEATTILEDEIMKIFVILVAWVVGSLIIGSFIGHFIDAGKGGSE
jgi:hypothetical protein